MPDCYCIRCGTKLRTQVVSGRERPICPACGWTLWSRASLGVGGMLEMEGRILFVERNIEPNAGLWTLVNGYVEADESLHEAVEREFYEETGLQVRALGMLAIWQTPAWLEKPDDNPNRWEQVNSLWCVFGVELVGSLADLHPYPVEVRQARFFALHELDQLQPVGHWSRWMAQNFHAQDGALYRQEIEPTFQAVLRDPHTTIYGKR